MPTVSADGMTYTFKLRPGVKFIKGDGTVLREMTADDVVASLNRILDPNLKPTPSPVGPAFFNIIAGGSGRHRRQGHDGVRARARSIR